MISPGTHLSYKRVRLREGKELYRRLAQEGLSEILSVVLSSWRLLSNSAALL